MKRSLKIRLAAATGVVMASVGSAMAAVPADVAAKTADLGTDGATIATTILVAIVAVFAIKFLRKGF